MVGIGWQELVIIGMSLVMCVGSLVIPVALLILVLHKVRESRRKQLQQMAADTPPRHKTPKPDQYETKYGFDETDWGSELDDGVDDEPRIVSRR